MSNKNEKTNVMRILDQKKIPYEFRYYGDTAAVAGTDVADVLGEEYETVFKTLVCVGKTGEHYVFAVPVNGELDLKKAASAVGEKNVEMIKSKELLPLTGYIHGGCSPIGMKKQFATVFDTSALSHEKIYFSAGKIGYQVGLSPSDAAKIIPLKFADIKDFA